MIKLFIVCLLLFMVVGVAVAEVPAEELEVLGGSSGSVVVLRKVKPPKPPKPHVGAETR